MKLGTQGLRQSLKDTTDGASSLMHVCECAGHILYLVVTLLRCLTVTHSYSSCCILPSLHVTFTLSLCCHPVSLSLSATFGIGHLPFNLTITHSHTLLIICACCCDEIKGLKTKIYSHTHSLILYL